MLVAAAITVAALSLYIKFAGLKLVKEQSSLEEQSMQGTSAESSTREETNYELSKMEQIDELIRNSYLKDYDRNDQMDAVYRAMLDSLNDPYSRYMNSDELKQLQQDINSAFTGTGIVFINDDIEGFVITEVVTGGPAAVAGIKEGDIILQADGKSYKTSEELISAIKGNPGTKVDLKVMRDDEEMEVSVIRGDVKGVSVESKTLDKENIGYIKIRSFGDETYSLFDSAISGFETRKVDGLILDLRDNPGGLFDEGVKIADRILAECTVTYTIDKSGTKENYNSNASKTGLNLVVLINGNTASTAEMIAAAIKTNGAGTLVGETTYGKGLIQETHVYEDGSAVNLTTKEFFPAGGTRIDGVGVSPDVTVSNDGAGTEDKQMSKAIQTVKGK